MVGFVVAALAISCMALLIIIRDLNASFEE